MPRYRLDLLSAADHIVGSIVLTCDDDITAIAEMATNVSAEDGAELWQGQRLILRVPPASETALAAPER
jgi:hypothetical protein